MSDIHFNTIDADQIYSEIIRALEESVGQPLYPGDERRIFGEGLVAVLVSMYNVMDDVARQKSLRYARGEVLDALGERTDTPRLLPASAETVMRFFVSEELDANVIIPLGTRVTPDGVTYFATSESAVISAGSLFVDVPATSEQGGAAYNGLPAGAIATLVDLIPFVSQVANITETTGGDDGEPYDDDGDNRYRERIRIAPARFSTAGPTEAYKYHAMSADPGIVSVNVFSPEPGKVTIVPLMEDGKIPGGDTLEKVYSACNAATVRPLTDYVEVQAPASVPFDIEVHYFVTADEEADAVQAIEGEYGGIQQYIEWQSGALGRAINPDQLRKYILVPSNDGVAPGAVRVDVISPVYSKLDEVSVAVPNPVMRITHEVI